jgi:hypothetical protein
MSAILGVVFTIFVFIFLPGILLFFIPVGWMLTPILIIGLLVYLAYKIYRM